VHAIIRDGVEVTFRSFWTSAQDEGEWFWCPWTLTVGKSPRYTRNSRPGELLTRTDTHHLSWAQLQRRHYTNCAIRLPTHDHTQWPYNNARNILRDCPPFSAMDSFNVCSVTQHNFTVLLFQFYWVGYPVFSNSVIGNMCSAHAHTRAHTHTHVFIL
jgi:hypothetical protein